jgi:hypothetical protein
MREETADLLAGEVRDCIKRALQSAITRQVLKWTAYSDTAIEKWLVVETYAELCRNWDKIVDIVPKSHRKNWDSWMEAELPLSKNCVDLMFGAYDTQQYKTLPEPRYVVRRKETLCFEFKMLRHDNGWSWNSQQVRKDIHKLQQAKLKYAYLALLFYFEANKSKPDMLNRLKKFSDLRPLGQADKFDWGPHLERISREDSDRNDMNYAMKLFNIAAPVYLDTEKGVGCMSKEVAK